MGEDFNRPNRYKIKGDGKQVFYAQEQTGCCRRQLMSCVPDCMSWEVRFFAKGKAGWFGLGGGDWQPAFDLHKPWSCNFLCFNRPKAEFKSHDGDVVFGYMTVPCCSMCPAFTVMDKNEETLMNASTSGCQWGLCFPCPFGPCAHVKIDLTDKNGQDIGYIDKEIPCGKCCCKFLAPGQQVDHYNIDLSKMPDATHKALAMALAVFIDFRYFSNQKDENDEDAIKEDQQDQADDS